MTRTPIRRFAKKPAAAKPARPRWAQIARSVGLPLAFGALLVVLSTSNALAAGGTDPSTILSNICDFILGPFGQSLAVLGIIAIGVSWMFGRASLGLIAGVIGGIVIMFGASYIGSKLTGS